MKKNSRFGFVLVGVLPVVGCGEAGGVALAGHQGVVEFEERAVAFEVGGRVTRVVATRGQGVAAGALMASLDDSLARPVREARAAEVDAARARLSLLRAGARPSDVRALEAQVEGARATEATLSRNLERARGLAASGAAPTAQVDDLQGSFERARAEHTAAEERLRTVRLGARPQEVAAAQAQLTAATQALAAEDQRLARLSLRAPQAGVVLDVIAAPGDVVAPGAPVAVVADTSHPYVDVFVPQASLADVRVGAAATVRVDATRARFAGRVEDVGRRTEFSPRYIFSERERPGLVVRVRVRVDDPAGRLHAGVPAFVALDGARP